MGIVARPVGDFVNGTVADGDQVDADLNAIYNEFNGSIDNNNIKSSAAIVGTKIAASPSGIPTDRINDDAVDASKLKDDAVTDSNRAVTRNHIRDLAINKAKVDLQTYSHVASLGSISAGASHATGADTGLSTSTTQPLMAYLITATNPQFLQTSFFQKTSTWWVAVSNVSPGAITVGANELKVVYLQ